MTPIAKLAITIALIIALAATMFIAGRKEGIRHAIEDSEIYATECYDPDHPDASEWNGYDLKIYIDLDGNTYVHGAFQG